MNFKPENSEKKVSNDEKILKSLQSKTTKRVTPSTDKQNVPPIKH